MDKILFTGEEGTEEFYVLEQTMIGGVSYLLVTDTEEDGDAWIMKDLSAAGEAEAIYEFVEEEQELEAVSRVFAEMLEDIDLV